MILVVASVTRKLFVDELAGHGVQLQHPVDLRRLEHG